MSVNFVVEIASLTLGFVIRGCGQLELEGCADILQGRERLEGHGNSIRGLHSYTASQRIAAVTHDRIARQTVHVH